MEDFRRQFLYEAVETLRRQLKDLRATKEFSAPLKREIFRTLHTVKGTAQTFGFEVSSRLAHELESIAADKESFPFLIQGIELLIESLTDRNFKIPAQFAEKFQINESHREKNQSGADDFSAAIPPEVFSQLSAQEKNRLRSAMLENDDLFYLEVNFKADNFAEEFIAFRELLIRTGEIIATFPGSDSQSSGGQIGFRMLVAAKENLPSLEAFEATIVFHKPVENTDSAAKILKQIACYGKELAAELGKQIEIKTHTDASNLSTARLKIIFDALVHLIRNAVDHAIEKSGTIEINLANEKNGFRLIMSDEGRGFDLEKIKAKAVEKNLIKSGVSMSENELIDLIFSPEFSTKSEITDISGRGIGLDAVKTRLKKRAAQ